MWFHCWIQRRRGEKERKKADQIVEAKLPNSRLTAISDPTERGGEVSGFGVFLRNNEKGEVLLRDP